MGASARVSDWSARLLRIVLVLDAAVFLGAALFNFGLDVPLGFTTLRFADSIWQAGTGETIIGAVLLAAGLTASRRLSWVALVMSVLGIAFGLSSDRVQGAARNLHVAMIALAVLVLVLLLVTGRRNRRSGGGPRHVHQGGEMTVNRPGRVGYWRRRIPVTAGVLMAVAAAAFATVSIVHFGVDIPIGFTTISDSFPGAAPPEALIAAVVAVGATAVLRRWTKRRAIALGTTSFALLGTVYGLSITLNSTRTGDIAYHLGILATLIIILGLLLVPGGPDVQPARDLRSEVRSSS